MTLASKIAGLNAANVLLTDWAGGSQFRIYNNAYAAEAFNPSDVGNARFSPLAVADAAGGTRIVPTMYLGDSIEVALMETVLRDVPTPSAGFVLRMPSPAKEPRRLGEVHLVGGGPPAGTLKMADLRAPGLKRLGLTRTEAIECDSSSYRHTRALARWTYENVTAAQGILWTSRQHGSGEAVILFKDRLSAAGVVPVDVNQPISSGKVFTALLGLTNQLGVVVFQDP